VPGPEYTENGLPPAAKSDPRLAIQVRQKPFSTAPTYLLSKAAVKSRSLELNAPVEFYNNLTLLKTACKKYVFLHGFYQRKSARSAVKIFFSSPVTPNPDPGSREGRIRQARNG
jgi:hypothetical protein